MMKMSTIKSFFAKIKIPLQQIFFLGLAVFLLSLLLYLRFLPKTARGLWDNLTTGRIILLCFTIIIILFNMYNTIKLLGLLPEKNSFPRIQNIKSRLAAYYSVFLDLFKNLYDFCWYISGYIAEILFHYECLHYMVIRKLVKSFNNPRHFPYYFLVLMCLKFIPRIVFVVVFFVEAIFYNHLDITFRCIPFLLLVFLEDIFIFIIEDFYNAHFKGLRSFVNEKVQGTTNRFNYGYKPSARDQYPYGTKNDEDFLVNHFTNAFIIPDTLAKYSEWKNYKKISNGLLLFLQCLRLITYIYILYFGITFMQIF